MDCMLPVYWFEQRVPLVRYGAAMDFSIPFMKRFKKNEADSFSIQAI